MDWSRITSHNMALFVNKCEIVVGGVKPKSLNILWWNKEKSADPPSFGILSELAEQFSCLVQSEIKILWINVIILVELSFFL